MTDHQQYLEAPYIAEAERSESEDFARRHGFDSIEDLDEFAKERQAEHAREARIEQEELEAEQWGDRTPDDSWSAEDRADVDSFEDHYGDGDGF